MWYREDKSGQILQEGITEAGAMASWIASATSYSTHGVQTVPFFIFYSMFGFQRIGDFAWAAADMRSRGFLIGGTAGRTTLNGEGLQHEDGHSHLFASAIPNCVPYDPTYGYEVAVIIQDGLRRMLVDQEDVYYYITVMNENYHHPAMPAGVEGDILRGMYLLRAGEPVKPDAPRVQLLGSGTILREVEAAATLLRDDFGVTADVWSVTSFTLLGRDGLETERQNMLHPLASPKVPFVEQQLAGHAGPVVAASDYVKMFAEQVRPFIDRRFHALGTDGFGRSDARAKLRPFFEVDRHWIVLAALRELAAEGKVAAEASGASDRKIRHRSEQAESGHGLRTHRNGANDRTHRSRSGRFEDVPIIEVMVASGDRIGKDAPLVTLESDKATMEVPASAAGVVREVKVKIGDRVSTGSMSRECRSRRRCRAGGRPRRADRGSRGRRRSRFRREPRTKPRKPLRPDTASSAGAELADLVVPDIGDFSNVPVISVFIKAGDDDRKRRAAGRTRVG